MGIKWSEPPRTFHEFIQSDTLDNLFRCGHCGHSLIDALTYATAKLGVTLDVRCPGCNEVWTFIRIPDGMYQKEQLTHKDLDPIEQTINGLALVMASRVGRCARCGRELTNPDSVAAGIGPVCATKVGPDTRAAAFWSNSDHGNN